MDNELSVNELFRKVTGKYSNGLFHKNRDLSNYVKIHKFIDNVINHLNSGYAEALMIDDEYINIKINNELSVVDYVECGNIGLRIGNTSFILFDPDFSDHNRFIISDDMVNQVKQKVKLLRKIEL